MSILKNFVKYQSLGNDFIIFDWYKRPAVYMQQELLGTEWKKFIMRICDRHYGVGADNVLIITGSAQMSMPEILIFNADGSQAEMCLNGARSVAHYLYSTYNFPDRFALKVGLRSVECFVSQLPKKTGSCDVTMRVGTVNYEGQRTVTCDQKNFQGHVVSIGNPHFIIFEKITLAWLKEHGKSIESHELFPYRTNVEFVWEIPSMVAGEKAFEELIYERGCGITLACGSGATATVGLFFEQGLITPLQKVSLKMPGGTLLAWVDADKNILLQASAQLIFKGTFEDHIEEYCQLRPQFTDHI